MKRVKRDEARYDPAFLRSLFTIGVDSTGKWRVYHAVDRMRGDGHISVRAGDLADTSIEGRGYRRCSLPRDEQGRQRHVLAHCVIWAIYYNFNPGGHLIDHANRDKLDNDPVLNLSPVDSFESIVNRSVNDGPLGVWPVPAVDGTPRYRAGITDPTTGKVAHLGRFATVEAAQKIIDAFILDRRGPNAPTNRSLGRIATKEAA